MSNTLTSVSATMIADTLIPALRLALVPVDSISTTITDNTLSIADVVNVPLMGSASAAAYSTSYETGDNTTTSAACTVTSAMSSWYVSPAEAMYGPARFLEQGVDSVKAVGDAVVQAITALFLESNCGTGSGNERVVTAANFDADDVSDCLEDLAGKGVSEASLILMPSYHNALRKDNAIHYADAYGSNAVMATGKIPLCHGMPVHQINGLPTAIDNENTFGFALGKSAAACVLGQFGGRFPDLESSAGVRTEVMTDPETGLTLTYRQWVNSASGYVWGSAIIAYGCAFGKDACVRIASA